MSNRITKKSRTSYITGFFNKQKDFNYSQLILQTWIVDLRRSNDAVAIDGVGAHGQRRRIDGVQGLRFVGCS